MSRMRSIINRLDKERLGAYLADSVAHGPAHQVRRILETARPVPPARVPPDVVTMNSQVSILDPRDSEIEHFILAYPDHEDPKGYAISVLSPLGAALFAARVGEEVTVLGARGPRAVVVSGIEYQPERAGDLDL